MTTKYLKEKKEFEDHANNLVRITLRWVLTEMDKVAVIGFNYKDFEGETYYIEVNDVSKLRQLIQERMEELLPFPPEPKETNHANQD